MGRTVAGLDAWEDAQRCKLLVAATSPQGEWEDRSPRPDVQGCDALRKWGISLFFDKRTLRKLRLILLKTLGVKRKKYGRNP
jgi:hypothetical protein